MRSLIFLGIPFLILLWILLLKKAEKIGELFSKLIIEPIKGLFK